MNCLPFIKTQFKGCKLIVSVPQPLGFGVSTYYDLGDQNYFGYLSKTTGPQVFHKEHSHHNVRKYLDEYLLSGTTAILVEPPVVRKRPVKRGLTKAEAAPRIVPKRRVPNKGEATKKIETKPPRRRIIPKRR